MEGHGSIHASVLCGAWMRSQVPFRLRRVFSASYVHASSLWPPHIHHSEATPLPARTLALVPLVPKSGDVFGVRGAGHRDNPPNGDKRSFPNATVDV